MPKTNPNFTPESLFQKKTWPPNYYEFHIKGYMVPNWADWFEDLTATILDNDEIILSGPVADQAALHGLITRIRDLNLELIHIKNVTHEQLCRAKPSN